jgi:hypothetical protein
MKTVSKFFTEHSYRNSYILVGILAIIGYPIMRALFINQDAYGYVLSSQLTFNLIILFGLWGWFHKLLIKVKNPMVDLMIVMAGFIVIVMILRIAGMRTIFG